MNQFLNMKYIDPIELTYTLPVSVDEVFDALTNPETIEGWGGGGALVEPGGVFRMFDGWVEGEVLVFEPPSRLSYTWKPNNWSENVPATVVTYDLTAQGSETLVQVRHEGFIEQKERDSHAAGWDEHFFGPMAAFFARKRSHV